MINAFLNIINALFVFFFFILMVIKTIRIIKEMYKAREDRQKNRVIDFNSYMGQENMIPISIILPVQEQVDEALSCIEMLLDLDYRSKELIIVNDGSNENINKAIIERFGLEEIEHSVKQTIRTNSIKHIYYNKKYPEILYIDKRRGGVADAINCGINVSQCPLYICVEQGMKITRDALLKLSFEFFKDSAMTYSCGITRIDNKQGKIGFSKGIRTIECINMTITNDSGREAAHTLFTPISGPYALIQKQAVLDVGGYNGECDNMHYDLILRIQEKFLEKPNKMLIVTQRNVMSCIDFKEKPANKPKKRYSIWQKGTIQALNRQMPTILNNENSKSILPGFIYNYIFNIIYVVFEALSFITLPLAALRGLIKWEEYLYVLLLYFLIRILYNLTALSVDQQLNESYLKTKTVFPLFLYSFLEAVAYHQVVTIKRTLSIIDYLLQSRKKNRLGEEKIIADKPPSENKI